MELPQTQTTSGTSSLDQNVVNLAKAIRQTESGGDFHVKGKSGEYGAYQFTDPTWNTTAKKYGVNVQLEQATPEEQNQVAYSQLKEWKDKGYNVGQIASMWNAGQGEPDAYLGKFSDGTPSSGTNKYKAKYDVPAYAKSVATAYQTLKQGGQVSADPNNPSSIASTVNANVGKPSDLGGEVLGGLKWLGNVLFPIVPDVYNDITGQGEKKSFIKQVADLGLSALPFIPGIGEAGEGLRGVGIAADVAKGAEVAKGTSLASKVLGSSITKMAGVGGAAGALGSISEGGGAKQTLQGTAWGAATGATLGGIGKLFTSVLSSLPSRLTQGVFKGITPETAGYALQNKSIGSVSKMLAESNKATSDLQNNINGILTNSKYANSLGNLDKAAQDTLSKFINAGFKSTQDIAEAIKSVVPLQTDLVDKVVYGPASLAEKNALRSAIDRNVYSVRGELPKLTADKTVANTFANYLRNEVQTIAKETQPLFSDWSNEIGLQKALVKLNKKGINAISFRSLMGAILGMSATGGNPLGAAAGYGLEKLSSSPGTDFLMAKVLNKGSQFMNSPLGQKAGLIGNILTGRAAGSIQAK